jgi:hypothetical protein
MSRIDFGAPANVYLNLRRVRRQQRGTLGFRRFATLAEAVRFIIEELPGDAHSAYIDVEDERLDMEAIRQLYASEAYPLERRSPP